MVEMHGSDNLSLGAWTVSSNSLKNIADLNVEFKKALHPKRMQSFFSYIIQIISLQQLFSL